jgi:iron complex outermembrane receptor protein
LLFSNRRKFAGTCLWLTGALAVPGSGAFGQQQVDSAVLSAAAAQAIVPECQIIPGTAREISGTVLDPSGRPIAGASVEALCGAYQREAVTDDTGTYHLRLPGGPFTVSAQQTGFAPAVQVLPAGPLAGSIDFAMSMAGSSNSMTVTAGPDYVATTSSTGTKTDTPLINLPQSVSSISLPQMKQRDVQTIQDTMRYTAGVDAEPYGPDLRADGFFIRGFNETYDGLYLDGLALPKVSGELETWTANPFSLQSVAVIKGPSSVLYGGNEPGGLVDLVSKRPPTTPQGEVQFEAGNFSRFQGYADIGGPLFGSDKWYYRVNGLAHSSGTQVRFAQDKQQFIAPSFTWKPNARTTLTVLNQYMNIDAGSAGQFLPAQGMILDGSRVPANPNGQIPIDTFDSDPSFDDYHKIEYFSGYAFQRELTRRIVFRQNFRWDHLELPNYIGLYGLGYTAPNGADATCAANPNAPVCTSTIARASFAGSADSSQSLVDNQLQANVTTGAWNHTLLAGYNYNHEGARVESGYGTGPDLNLFNPVYPQAVTRPAYSDINTNGTLQQHGVYLQDQAARGGLSVLLSGREDWALEDTRDFVAGDVIHQNASKFTGRAGVLYHTKLGVAPYFSYSTSFNPIPGVNAYGQAFVPDTGKQYEVGAKWQPHSVNAFLTASLFQLTENNVQTTDPDNPLNTVQTAQERSRGIELEGQASLTRHVDMVGSFTHEQVLYTRPYYGAINTRPQTVPANMASLWVNYNAANGFGAGAGARFTGITPGDAGNTFFVPGRTEMDGEVHYTTGPLRAAMNGKNLLNKTYVGYCYSATDCNYGYQRTFDGSLTYSFASLLHPWHQQ